MKKLALAASILVISAISASAADLPARTYTKAPPMMAAPSWTGFYVGATAGARFSDVNMTSPLFAGGVPDPTTNGVNLDSTGPRLGGILGYNLQVSPSWVIGIEGDGAWGNNRKTSINFPGSVPGPTDDSVSNRLNWDASIRARAGYLVTPSTLVYATGGVAWQNIKNTATCGPTNATSFCGFFFTNASFTDQSTKAGWTAGGGVETIVWTNWTARAEYRYSDFGSSTLVVPPLPTVGFTETTRVNTHTALLGIAYKFGN
jgi:outer membrane immunogenic protein